MNLRYKCPRCGRISNHNETSRWKKCQGSSGCGRTLSRRHMVEQI